MTITAEQIKKALAPVTEVKKTDPVGVDLEKVTTAFSEAVTEFADSDDPMASLDALETTVGKFEQLLEDATSDDNNVVVVTGKSVEFAKSFAPDVTFVAPEVVVAEKTEAVTDDGTKVEETTEKSEESEEPKVEETAKTDDEVDPKVDTEVETAKTDADDDLSNDIDWEADMAPSEPPTMRNERLTKGERPVPARKGGRKATRKAADARKAAMAKRKKPVLDSDA